MMHHHEMLDCDAVMRQLWDYLDGELTADRMDAIRAHLAMCDRCQPQAEFERAFLDVLAAERGPERDTAALSARVRGALATRGYSIS